MMHPTHPTHPGKYFDWQTYVACWRVYKREKLIEVYYAGTHEKAPY